MSEPYNIDADFDYYVKHQSELVGRYDGKFVVIVKQEVVGVYDTLDEAFDDAKNKYKPGEFFLHQVGEGKDNYTAVVSRTGFYV